MIMQKSIPVVILAGGLGLRMRDYSESLPKALVPIGSMAVIHHVMKIYAHQGFNRFIICLGYRGELIKDYFSNLHLRAPNVKPFTNVGSSDILGSKKDDFEITFVDTGLNTQTGGRIKKIEEFIDTDDFFATYCDSLADMDLNALLEHHKNKNKVATMTVVHPTSPFGMVEVDDGLIKSFKEKPMLPGLINGGFFTFNKKIFDYLDGDSILEEDPLRKLTAEGQLAAYNHNGFWTCMDTHKDVDRLNKLWETRFLPNVGVSFQKVPWKIWDD